MFDHLKQRDIAERSTTNRINNEMDEPISNTPKKCSLCRTKRHNRSNYIHRSKLTANIILFFNFIFMFNLCCLFYINVGENRRESLCIPSKRERGIC